jgi:hypothetical protein
MNNKLLIKIASEYIARKNRVRRVKTAGEVRFVKDNSGDASSWAFINGPSARSIVAEYAFNPKNSKHLAKVLRSTTASLGHVMAAYAIFAKLKSSEVSPDGNLGGKGYIQRVTDMRRQYMNVIEALSSISDTLYDEVRAPHWTAISRQQTPEEKEEISKILNDAEEIRENPESWAEEEMNSLDEDDDEDADDSEEDDQTEDTENDY